ncbi:hypothetical protein BJX64DRAFT_32955 [Aspergillus heterothallicus]
MDKFRPGSPNRRASAIASQMRTEPGLGEIGQRLPGLRRVESPRIGREERRLLKVKGNGKGKGKEEDSYEDEISDRLRRLNRHEEKGRLEEERRKDERLEAERERLKELQRRIDEEEKRDEEARMAERKATENAMKEAAEEWMLAKERQRIAERKAAARKPRMLVKSTISEDLSGQEDEQGAKLRYLQQRLERPTRSLRNATLR